MAVRSWLVDSNRIATKIKCASGSCEPGGVNWKSNPSRPCPNCQHVIDNSDVTQEWPGLPRGVKFDPSDQEIIYHLLAKAGVGNSKPHPFIDEFIPTVNEDDGICYTHPRNLPGVKQDGTVSHFFHRAIKAYNTGTRKRRKIQGDDCGDVRWHKTGRTKPVVLDGIQKGCKKIMVLYVSPLRGGKAEKTNWVMHQYHLGTGEDEMEGQYVISKVFYQQQLKQVDKLEEDIPEGNVMIPKVDPVTPQSVTPAPPRAERRPSEMDTGPNSTTATCVNDNAHVQHHELGLGDEEEIVAVGEADHQEGIVMEDGQTHLIDNNNADQTEEEPKWWDSESQNLLNSQQLVEGLSLCDDLLRSQSPDRDENEDGVLKDRPFRLGDYARLGTDCFKKDLEECRDLVIDPADIDLDTPPDFRLSQLEFASQDSFLAWGGNNADEGTAPSSQL